MATAERRVHLDVLNLPPKQLPVIGDDRLLASVLHPCKVEEFHATHWRRKALALIPRAGHGKAAEARLGQIASELHDLDLRAMLESTASERIFAWMRPTVDAPDGDSSALRSFELDPAAALACHECGASLYFRAPPSFCEEWISKISDQLGLGAGARHPSGELRGEVEVFVSRAGHSTDWHFDFMENFTLQLRGSKTWRIYRGEITHPARGATPHYRHAGTLEQQVRVHRLQSPGFGLDSATRARIEAESESVTLTAGSALYFPAGAWHRVEAPEDSLSLNFSLLGLSWAELVADAARHRALSCAQLRQIVCVPPGASRKARRAAALSECTRALEAQRALLAGIRAEDLLPEAAFGGSGSGSGCGSLEDGGSASGIHVLDERVRLASAEGFGAGLARKPEGQPSREASRQKRPKAESDAAAPAAVQGGGLRFQLNPLCSIVADSECEGELSRKLKEARAAAEEEGEEESEGEDEEGKASEDPDADDCLFSLSLNFGGEDLLPHSRTLLWAPQRLAPLMQWLAHAASSRCNCDSDDPRDLANRAELALEEVEAFGLTCKLPVAETHQLLRVLLYQGYAHRIPPS